MVLLGDGILLKDSSGEDTDDQEPDDFEQSAQAAGALPACRGDSSSDEGSDDSQSDDDAKNGQAALALTACRLQAKQKVNEAHTSQLLTEVRDKIRLYSVSTGIPWLGDDDQVVGLAFQALHDCKHTASASIHVEECKNSKELTTRKKILDAVTRTVAQNRRDLTSRVRVL